MCRADNGVDSDEAAVSVAVEGEEIWLWEASKLSCEKWGSWTAGGEKTCLWKVRTCGCAN